MRAGAVVERDEPARTVGRPPNVLHRQAEPNVVAQPKPVGVGLQVPLGLTVAGKVGKSSGIGKSGCSVRCLDSEEPALVMRFWDRS